MSPIHCPSCSFILPTLTPYCPCCGIDLTPCEDDDFDTEDCLSLDEQLRDALASEFGPPFTVEGIGIFPDPSWL